MKFALQILLLCTLVRSSYGADKWLSVESKNFLLVGNASESHIREAGLFLEEYRKSLGLIFPRIEHNISAPTTVLIFKNDANLKPYGSQSGLAFFQPGDDVNYIVLSASSDFPPGVLHAYTHLLAQENAGSIPLWVIEGLAEAYSTFENKRRNEFRLGIVPKAHVATLRDNPLLPLKTLFEQDQGSFHYNENKRQDIFYAESWALMHYLMFGPNTGRRPQLLEFMRLASGSVPVEDAFVQAFQTNYGALMDELRDYLSHPLPTLKVVSNQDPQVNAKPVAAKPLTDAEVEYYLGDLLLHAHRLPEAERHLKKALSQNPNLLPAQASMGMLQASQKKYEEALTLLHKAVESDPTNYLYHFYYASVLQRMEQEGVSETDSGERRDAMRAHLNLAIDAAPRFVAAYQLLASINIAAGEVLSGTETLLKKALAVMPGREELRMLLAQDYLRAKRTADASALLSEIAHVTQDPNTRKRAAVQLDELARVQPVFTEILPEPAEAAKADDKQADSAPLPSTNSRRDTVLQPLTPISPGVEGEQMTGLLTLLDCTNGLTLHVQTDTATVEMHSSQPDKIQFVSYTTDVSNNIACGPQSPGISVLITYRPVPGGPDEPLVIEFTEKK